MKKDKKCMYCGEKADRVDITGVPVCEKHKKTSIEERWYENGDDKNR